MAAYSIRIKGTDRWFVFGDDSGNYFKLFEDRIENVSSGNGDDFIIATQNQLGLDAGGPHKPNPVYRHTDIVDAQGGDDRIIIEASGGTYRGGDGDDRISNDGPVTGRGFTKIYGDDDSFQDTAGHGNDEISAGDGNEIIDGGEGSDWLLYDNADSGVYVTLGNVNADGSYQWGSANGGSGSDRLLRIEHVGGSAFGDTITGNNVDNQVSGGNGNDWIRGRDGEDQLFGNAGNDNLSGGNHNDELFGGAGNDGLDGGPGNDWLVPGTGDNKVVGGLGSDTIDYSAGSQAIFANLAQNFVRKGAPTEAFEIDTVYGVENLLATRYDDFVFGNSLSNNIQGRGGNDAISGLDSGDVISGGSGNDFLFGNQGSDALSGGRHDDVLDGGTEGDFLYGNSGNDTLIGGPGSDLLNGQAGADRYVWRPGDFASLSRDKVFGFQPLEDTLVFAGIVDDPATAQASDYLQANVVDGNTILTFDFDGTPGPSTGPNYNRFVELVDYEIENAQLDVLQFVGGIEFV